MIWLFSLNMNLYILIWFIWIKFLIRKILLKNAWFYLLILNLILNLTLLILNLKKLSCLRSLLISILNRHYSYKYCQKSSYSHSRFLNFLSCFSFSFRSKNWENLKWRIFFIFHWILVYWIFKRFWRLTLNLIWDFLSISKWLNTIFVLIWIYKFM